MAAIGAWLLRALAWVASSALGRFVIDIIVSKLAQIANDIYLSQKRRKENKEKSQESVDPLKKAKTADEIDKATDSALDGF